MSLALVVMFALVSAFLFALANVLEQREAATVPEARSMRLGLLGDLARRPRWLLGMGSDVGGYLFQATAFGLGSLVFVAPLGATSLMFALALMVAYGRHPVARADWWRAVVLAGGLALFLLEAAPDGGTARAPLSRWIVVGPVVGGVIVLSLIAGRRTAGSHRAFFYGLTAGTTYGVTAALTKTMVDLLGQSPLKVVTNWEPYALAVLVAFGMVVTQSAFQAGPLTASLPALEVSEPVVAVIIGIALFDERIAVSDVTDRILIVLAVAAMVWGAVRLSLTHAASEIAVPST